MENFKFVHINQTTHDSKIKKKHDLIINVIPPNSIPILKNLLIKGNEKDYNSEIMKKNKNISQLRSYTLKAKP